MGIDIPQENNDIIDDFLIQYSKSGERERGDFDDDCSMTSM